MSAIKLTCLYNADGEVVGYFSDYGVAMAARQEWNKSYSDEEARQYTEEGEEAQLGRCRSHELSIAPLELEDVKPGDDAGFAAAPPPSRFSASWSTSIAGLA